jgi:hypothetical protein
VTLAVQTLRNSILVSSFVGAGVLSIGVNQAMLYEDYLPNNHRATTSCCIVSASFICSFLCWTNVIRYCAHLGYLIGSMTHEPKKPAPVPEKPAADRVANMSTSTTADGHHDDLSGPLKKIGFVEQPDVHIHYATQLTRYLLMNFRYDMTCCRDHQLTDGAFNPLIQFRLSLSLYGTSFLVFPNGCHGVVDRNGNYVALSGVLRSRARGSRRPFDIIVADQLVSVVLQYCEC